MNLKNKHPAVPTTGCLHQCPFRSFCNAKLQRALVLLFHWNTTLLVLAEKTPTSQKPVPQLLQRKTAAST